jgi:hypothetical protein
MVLQVLLQVVQALLVGVEVTHWDGAQRVSGWLGGWLRSMVGWRSRRGAHGTAKGCYNPLAAVIINCRLLQQPASRCTVWDLSYLAAATGIPAGSQVGGFLPHEVGADVKGILGLLVGLHLPQTRLRYGPAGATGCLLLPPLPRVSGGGPFEYRVYVLPCSDVHASAPCRIRCYDAPKRCASY